MLYNDWVYEKVCLDELSITTTVNSKLSYTPCYKYVLFLFYQLKNINYERDKFKIRNQNS